MRILHIVPHYYPAVSFGGPPIVVHSLASQMAKKHSVTVFTTDIFDARNRISGPIEQIINAVKVYYFPNLSNWLTYTYNFYLPVRMLYRLANQVDKYDLVHIHEYYTLANLVTAWASKRQQVVQVMTGHGTLKPLVAAGRVKRKIVYHRLFSQYIFDTVAIFIAVSESERQDFLALGIPDKKIRLIPNGINLTKYRLRPSQPSYWLNQIGFRPCLLFLGRLQQKKGVELLIEAVAKLVKQFPNIGCIIAGPKESPSYYRRLQRLTRRLGLEKRVFFQDTVTGQAKLALLKSADVFILPSFGEGLATVLLEAAASRIPIVATRLATPADFIQSQAVQVCELSAQSLSQQITLLLLNQELARQQVKNAYQLVKLNYSIEKVSEQTLSLYSELLNSP